MITLIVSGCMTPDAIKQPAKDNKLGLEEQFVTGFVQADFSLMIMKDKKFIDKLISGHGHTETSKQCVYDELSSSKQVEKSKKVAQKLFEKYPTHRQLDTLHLQLDGKQPSPSEQKEKFRKMLKPAEMAEYLDIYLLPNKAVKLKLFPMFGGDFALFKFLKKTAEESCDVDSPKH